MTEGKKIKGTLEGMDWPSDTAREMRVVPPAKNSTRSSTNWGTLEQLQDRERKRIAAEVEKQRLAVLKNQIDLRLDQICANIPFAGSLKIIVGQILETENTPMISHEDMLAKLEKINSSEKANEMTKQLRAMVDERKKQLDKLKTDGANAMGGVTQLSDQEKEEKKRVAMAAHLGRAPETAAGPGWRQRVQDILKPAGLLLDDEKTKK